MADFRALIRSALQDRPSQQSLATELGVSQQQISYLLNEAKQPSAEMAIKLERVLGVPRSEIRPDLWTPSDQRAAS